MNDNNTKQDTKIEEPVIEAAVEAPVKETPTPLAEEVAPTELEALVVVTEPEAVSTVESAPKTEVSEEPASTPIESGSTEDPSPLEPVQDDKKNNPNANPDKIGAKWYVVHTYSGHENKVAITLKQRVESEHLEEKILDILVPMQDKIEIKGGKKVTIKEKIFPGYILVKMVLDDLSWLAVRTTQGVTSFVGIGNKPTPISEAEVATIVKFTQNEAPVYKQVFTVDDTVKIVDGPFADFIGKIDNVDAERGKVKVLVSIFGRETPVELDFLQVQKI